LRKSLVSHGKNWTIAAAVTVCLPTANANAQRTLGKVRVSQSVMRLKEPMADSITYITVKGKIVDGIMIHSIARGNSECKGKQSGLVQPNGVEYLL
jgi:hypothetical protein